MMRGWGENLAYMVIMITGISFARADFTLYLALYSDGDTSAFVTYEACDNT